MLQGVYSAATALETASMNQDLLAENLAHASTPGYRRQGLIFEVMPPGPDMAPALRNSLGARLTESYTHFDQGPIQYTGNSLDVALNGDGFFVLEGSDGPVYTRNGVFEVNAAGELQSKGGMRVQGQGGRIVVPPDAAGITITRDGVVLVNNAEVGRLRVVTFANPQTLRRVGATLFNGQAPQTVAPGAVHFEQGYREGSNVQVVNEMIAMILGMRQYEAADRAMRTLSESMGLNTKPQQ